MDSLKIQVPDPFDVPKLPCVIFLDESAEENRAAFSMFRPFRWPFEGLRGRCATRFITSNGRQQEDWSWNAPLLPDAVCLGVHEDFPHEVQRLRGAVPRPVAVQLGPVALHSSACLHVLSSVQGGAAHAAAPQVRPAVVQQNCAPRAASARDSG